ncbi:MAG: HD domain-containing protein [Armatimonadetes bacterium]|nr:HD domain-containing protein [Armatimonadota bacterium]
MCRVLLARREELAATAASLGGVGMMRAYSDLTDVLIRRIFQVAATEAEVDSPAAVRKALRDLAIVAVGGYGRREMSPFSDVDVTFIVGGEADHEVDLVVKKAFRILMDVLEAATLKVGYSYRRVDDVENLPLDTQTALLDARWIAGSSALFSAFHAALRDAIAPAAFVIGHIDARSHPGLALSSPYAVEPNIKEGRGGLRDLHAARWIAQIAYGLSGDDVWNGLRAKGVVLDSDISAVESATEFIARTRNALHLLAGRGLEVLSVERHDQLAVRMGFGSDVEPATREFISSYYRHSRELWRIYHKISEACLGRDLEIEPGVIARSGRLHILDKGLLVRDPAALIRLFQYTQCYGLHIHREADDLIASSALDYKLTPEAARSFVDVLSGPGAPSALRAMAELGVLQAIVPRFGELMFLVPGDAAHQFTVGEHSLRAVEQLDALFAEHNDQFIDIFSRVQNLEVLFLATMLHDIGKLDSKKDHSRHGAVVAAKFAAQLGMSEEECDRVEFLVRHHLRMSETARLRDLHQRKTIREFVSVVKDPQLLDMLFLLTVADYRAVGSSNWSRVQIRFLLELHERALAAIKSPDAPGPDLDRHRSRVRRELCLANLPPDEVDEHCASMPASYLLNTPPEELSAHIGYVRTARAGSPAVEIKDDRAGQFTLLTVVAMDKTGLLSEMAGALHAMSIDIHAAQIFTRHSPTDDIAIDILYIDYEGRQLAEMKKWQLEAGLANVLSGRQSVDELLRQWGRKKFDGAGSRTLRVLENLSDHETVVEIRAIDAPGILHYLTRRISQQGLNIHSARVATWGHEVRDVFYLTDGDGNWLTDERISRLDQALQVAD